MVRMPFSRSLLGKVACELMSCRLTCAPARGYNVRFPALFLGSEVAQNQASACVKDNCQISWVAVSCSCALGELVPRTPCVRILNV